ncbi:MAG: outer membrane lipoprotein LolB [Gammaproteobacteria bacterium]|nr:outer membrane lipoprotein LolB [Gammaproteobacteria bacterium]
MLINNKIQKKYLKQQLFIALIVLFLSACSNVAKEQKNVPLIESPDIDIAQVWTINGRISLTNEENNWYAKFRWVQKYDDFQISFTGPLGETELQVSQTNNQIVLETPKAKKVGHNLEQLIYQETGWKFPVTSLKYWLHGQSDPNIPTEIHYNKQQHIKKIIQSGWQIEYAKRMSVDYPLGKVVLLPKKIIAISKNMKIKLIVTNWHIENDE